MADYHRIRLLRMLAAAAASFAFLPLLLSQNSVVADASLQPHRAGRLRRRRALKQGRGRNRSRHPHFALLDPSAYQQFLGDDAPWASDNIPLLDMDDAIDSCSSLVRAYYFRWRVFRKHLRRTTKDSSAHPGGRSVRGDGVLCCEGSVSECTAVSAEVGWCSGAEAKYECHRRRTESRPCVWSHASARCTKGRPYGTTVEDGAACPAPRPNPSDSAASLSSSSSSGWVVTEFEPNVPWAGAHNTIACSAGHHLMEGRWLREPAYLDEYSRFWLREGEPRKYTFGVASAMLARYAVSGDAALLSELYAPLSANYQRWVDLHFSNDYGCFWQYADRDGQEHSVGGDGCRPLLNAVMVAEASALATIASLTNDDPSALRLQREAVRWQGALLSLWSPRRSFFVTRAIPRPESVPAQRWAEKQSTAARDLNQGRCPQAWPAGPLHVHAMCPRSSTCACTLNQGRCPRAWPAGQLVESRELMGLSSPWYFHAVPRHNASQYASSWQPLFDGQRGFAGRWGSRTAERADPCYNYTTKHECTWNGAPTHLSTTHCRPALHWQLRPTCTMQVPSAHARALPAPNSALRAAPQVHLGPLRPPRSSPLACTSCATMTMPHITPMAPSMPKASGRCSHSTRSRTQMRTPSIAPRGFCRGLAPHGLASRCTQMTATGYHVRKCMRQTTRIATADTAIFTQHSVILSSEC